MKLDEACWEGPSKQKSIIAVKSSQGRGTVGGEGAVVSLAV